MIVGDMFARRSERRVERLERLRVAAAEVIASYLQARSRLIAAREFGRPLDRDDLFPSGRPLSLALLFTLPGSEGLREPVLAACRVTLELIDAREEDMEAAYDRQLATLRALEDSVRRMVASAY